MQITPAFFLSNFFQRGSKTVHLFCIKLAYYKRKKVTKPDFRKKNVLAQNWAKWAQNGPNRGFLAIFSSLNHQISLILHIMIDSNDIQQVLVVIALKKNVPAQNGPIQAHLGMPGPARHIEFFFFQFAKNRRKKSLKFLACMTSCWPDTQKNFRFFYFQLTCLLSYFLTFLLSYFLTFLLSLTFIHYPASPTSRLLVQFVYDYLLCRCRCEFNV